MKWTDIYDIAITLADTHPDIDPKTVSFPDLYQWILALDGFNDDPQHCGERILEAIQAAWMGEVDED